jgi:hypothetical protein
LARSLPLVSALGLHEDLDFNLNVAKGTPIRGDDPSDHFVALCHVLVGEVGDIVRAEELADRAEVAVNDQR